MFSNRASLLWIIRGFAPLAALAFLLSGCGGGSGAGVTTADTAFCDPADPTTFQDCGTVFVSLTDAEGDFVSYSVDILSLTLTRPGGGSVETLPNATRVDFAQLTELSEIVSAVTLAPGDFNGGTIRVDYGNAEVFVEAGGDIVQAEVVDAHGQPAGIVDLDIQLADRDQLVVTRGRTALLTVDFDLSVSNDVDTTVDPVRVTARPHIVAEVEPVDEKEIRLRGALRSVDLDAGTYSVRVRPWHHHIGDHGEVTVHTTNRTSFEIGDRMLEGQEGLEALASLEAGTLTVAFGTLNVQNREFTAQIVHAGPSVAGDDIDAVYGNVVARTGDRLIVRGAFAVRPDRIARFHRTVIVEVGPGTAVYKIAHRDRLLDEDAISVGQRIVAFGQFADTDAEPVDAVAPDVAPVLDATDGRVRLLVTHLHGTVISVMPGQVNMRLRGIDRLGIDHFDFTGTGMTPELNADPTNYEIATSTLSLDRLVTDKWAKVLGFVTPFGMAPPDFEGRTVIDHRDIPAALGVGWSSTGTAAPFLRMGPDGLVIDLGNPDIDQRHHMLLGRRVVDLFDLPASPVIAPAGEGLRALYGISEPGHIELFKDFDDFLDELALRLGAGDAARSLAAYGIYDETTNTVTTNKVAVHMLPLEE